MKNKIKLANQTQAIVVYALISASGRQRQGDLGEFKTSLVYT